MRLSRLALAASIILAIYTYSNICVANTECVPDPTEAEKEPAGKNWILGIGISDYDSNAVWSDLRNARGDMRMICSTLVADFQFDESRTILLEDSNATRKNILDTLRFLALKMREQDNLIIYYAGHGYYSHKTKVGFWVPFDAGAYSSGFISCNELRSNGIANNPGLHIVLFIDACYSSGIFDDRPRETSVPDIAVRGDSGTRVIENHVPDHRGTKPDAEYVETLLDYNDKIPSREAFVSGRLTVVTDGADEHSPYAIFVYEYLTKERMQPFTLHELSVAVIPQVHKATRGAQVPRYGPLKDVGDEGGEFAFRIRTK